LTTVRRIAKNTAVLVIADIVSKISNFLFVMYIARYLGVNEFGILSFSIAFTGLFAIFSDMGLGTLMVREIARNKSLMNEYLNNVTIIKTILVAITSLLIMFIINLLGYPQQTILIIYILTLSVIFSAFASIPNSVFQAFEKMEYISIGKIIGSITKLTLMFILIWHSQKIIMFAWLYSFTNFIVLLYSLGIFQRKFRKIVVLKKKNIKYKFMKNLLWRAAPLGLSNIFLMVYFWVDRVMLSLMKGDIVVGYYSASYNLVNTLSLIPTAFVLSLFPLMSNYFNISINSLNKTYEYSLKYMAMLALPIAMGTILLSEKVIYVIYGTEFLASAQALKILILVESFVFVNMVIGYMQLSINKEKANMILNGIGMIINVVMNLLLIPGLSLMGAAIATLCTEFFYFAGGIYILSKAGYKTNFLKIIIKPLFATLIMGIFIYYFTQISLPILILLSVLLYFTILYLTKYLSSDDMHLIKQVWYKEPQKVK